MYDVQVQISVNMSMQSEVLVNATGTLSDAELATVELFKGYPDGLMIFATIACVIIMLVGIPGNIITIVALARYKKVRNATAIFIMSLSFSDLLFCCFNLPLTASNLYLRVWVHGQFLCRIFPLIRYALVANSLFTVLAITINRYIMIAHPKLYTKLYAKRNIIIMLVFTWMFPFGIMMPIFFEKYGRFGLDVTIGSCTVLRDNKNRSPKKLLILTSMILPCLAIILCYARIFCIVRKSTKKFNNTGTPVPKQDYSLSTDLSTSASVRVNGETNCIIVTEPTKTTKMSSKNTNTTDRSNNIVISYNDQQIITQPSCQPDESKQEQPSLYRRRIKKSMDFLKKSLPTQKDRRLGTMIIAIMMTYCLCHLPMLIIKALQEKNPLPTLNIAAHILFYLSSSLNPIIYVVMSNEYRKAYTNLFKRRKT